MAREARKLSEAGLYYVELRGEELFKSKADKEEFMSLAEKYFGDGKIFSAELSETSIKMFVKEGERGISLIMKSLSVSYARYFNRVHSINGSLFSGRFKSVPYEDEAQMQLAMRDASKKPAANSSAKKSAAETIKKPKTKQPKKSAVSKDKTENKIPPVKEEQNPEIKTEVKPEIKSEANTELKSEIKPEIKKEENKEAPKKKRNQMPSWLL